jgi:hypothetical protein
MKLYLVIVFFILSVSGISAQNLVGYKENEIRKFMSENKKEMKLDKVSNENFPYLKYSDRAGAQTILFFLNGDSVCQSIRIVCDEDVMAGRIKEFNSLYKKKSENKWTDLSKGRNCEIEVSEEKWASIISIKPVK